MIFSESTGVICMVRKCRKAKYHRKKTEHLIELVRDYTLLYNPRVPEHNDAQLTFNTSWRSTAEKLIVGKFGGNYKVHAPCILYNYFYSKDIYAVI